MDEAIERIRKRVFECVEPDRDLEDNELYTYIDEAILQENKSSIISMSQREKYRIEIFNSIHEIGR